MLAKQGIEVQEPSPAVSGSSVVSQPRALTRVVPAMFRIWSFNGSIIRAGVLMRRKPDRLVVAR